MRWKWIAGIIAGVLTAVFIACIVLVSRYDYNQLKPRISLAAKAATGRELTLGGNIDLKIGLSPALVVENIRFQNAPWSLVPEMLTIRRLEVKVALLPLLSGNIDVKGLILIEPNLVVEADKSGTLNTDFESSEDAIAARPADEPPAADKTRLTKLAFNKLRIEKGNITYNDGKSGRTVTLVLDTLNAEASGPHTPVKLEVRGAYRNEPFEVKGTLGPLSALLTHEKMWPLTLTAEAVDTTLTIDGAIKDPKALLGISVNFSIHGSDLGNLAKITGASLPLKGPFSVSGLAIDTGPKAYKVSDLAVKLGESDLKGFVGVSLATNRLFLSGDLSSRKIDLRPYMSGTAASHPAGKPAEAKKRRDKLFPNDPLPVHTLTKLDALVKINTDTLLLPRIACNDLTAETVLEEGHLKIVPVKAGIGGGRVEGQVELQLLGSSLNFAGKLQVKDSDLGRMLQELNVTDVLVGNVDLDLDIKSNGVTVAELMGALEGYTTLVMQNGTVKNKYINLLGGDLSSTAFRLLNPAGNKEEYTEFNCLINRFDIKQGVAECTVFVFDTNLTTVIGEGTIDLTTEKLDISFASRPKEGLGSKSTGKVNFDLGELAKPFKLSGTLTSPALAIDPTKAAIGIGKSIGGYTLFGPLGVASALLSRHSPEENPCLVAIEAIQKGIKSKPKEEKGSADHASEWGKEKARDVGRGLQRLFGR